MASIQKVRTWLTSGSQVISGPEESENPVPSGVGPDFADFGGVPNGAEVYALHDWAPEEGSSVCRVLMALSEQSDTREAVGALTRIWVCLQPAGTEDGTARTIRAVGPSQTRRLGSLDLGSVAISEGDRLWIVVDRGDCEGCRYNCELIFERPD